MLNEIYEHLKDSDSIYDFADAVIVVRLKMTRDMYLDEIERLNKMQDLNEWQKQDHEDLSGDVLAINRVLGFYIWTEDKEDE